jgi:hypothetical protein
MWRAVSDEREYNLFQHWASAEAQCIAFRAETTNFEITWSHLSTRERRCALPYA